MMLYGGTLPLGQQIRDHGLLERYLRDFKIAPENRDLALGKWFVYFGRNTLENFQELCRDVGITEDISSKVKCRKALAKVNVNIPQFLRAAGSPSIQVIHFDSPEHLRQFTKKKGKKNERMIPKGDIPKGCPLRKLLERMF